MRTTALVIPAWQEAESIGAVLDEVPPEAVNHVIVVVGSPADPTAAVARRRDATALVQKEPGYGAACWTGAQAAMTLGADVIVFLDGDYADPPAELPRVLEPIMADHADLVLGTRDLSNNPHALPGHARLGNRLVLRLLNHAIGSNFRDLPSFKAIRTDALQGLDMREMTYGWTVEMLVKAERAHLRIEEVAVPCRPRLAGRSKVAGSFRGTLGAASKLLACALAYAAWRPRAERGRRPAGSSSTVAARPASAPRGHRRLEAGHAVAVPVEAYFGSPIAVIASARPSTDVSPQEAAPVVARRFRARRSTARLRRAVLQGVGEPLLNRDLGPMIRYLKRAVLRSSTLMRRCSRVAARSN
jgi:hypothetical protein